MAEATEELQAVLDNILDGKLVEFILEAGCGSVSQIRLDPKASLVGIDTSEKQLERNVALDVRILGDLQTYILPKAHFDMIVCWDVLEHLPHPMLALENFVQAIEEDGLILLALPNVYSMKGILTKFTPFWFHVWTRRHLFGEISAGTDDHGPFPTFLRASVAPNSIRKFAVDHGMIVEYFRIYESPMHRLFGQRNRRLGLVWHYLSRIVQVLSINRISADLTDYIILLRKPQIVS